jgi:hypothetical protein
VADPRKRMFPPAIATDPDLRPLWKRAAFEAMFWLAEDSGCLKWSAREIRNTGIPLEHEVAVEDVAGFMEECVAQERVWPYRVGGTVYAFIPVFVEWEKALTRKNGPLVVPLPPGIGFEPFTDQKNNWGAGRYTFPQSRAEMLGIAQADPPKPATPPKPSSLPPRPSSQGAAPGPLADRDRTAKEQEDRPAERDETPKPATVRCECCGGTGRLWESDKACSICNGSGRLSEEPF